MPPPPCLFIQAILRKVQDSAMMLKRDADMKKRILEAKQKYDGQNFKNQAFVCQSEEICINIRILTR